MRTPLATVRGLGSAKDGTTHFWRQRLTAVANVPMVIFLIWLVVSLVADDYATVAARLGSPLVSVLLSLSLFSVLFHMRLGMQVIIEDYIHGEFAKVVLIMANTFYAVLVGAICGWAILRLALGA